MTTDSLLDEGYALVNVKIKDVDISTYDNYFSIKLNLNGCHIYTVYSVPLDNSSCSNIIKSIMDTFEVRSLNDLKKQLCSCGL